MIFTAVKDSFNFSGWMQLFSYKCMFSVLTCSLGDSNMPSYYLDSIKFIKNTHWRRILNKILLRPSNAFTSYEALCNQRCLFPSFIPCLFLDITDLLRLLTTFF